jgi:hypothetical protein
VRPVYGPAIYAKLEQRVRIRLIIAAALLGATGLVAGVFGPATRTAGAATFYRAATPDRIPLIHAITGDYGAYAGKCVDVPGGIPADGKQLQIWDCNGTAAQTWTSGPHGQAMAFGMCMDVAWASTDDGAKVQLAWCYPNDPAQQWVIYPNGNLVNPNANKCLDVRDWRTDNGAPLQIWDCTGGANQKWHLTDSNGNQWP